MEPLFEGPVYTIFKITQYLAKPFSIALYMHCQADFL